MKAFIFLFFLLISSFSFSQTSDPSNKTIMEFTKGMEKHAGYFNYYWDSSEGRIFLEVGKFNTEFLYINSLSEGIGSNDIGLDRGQLGDNRVEKFIRIGRKILLVQPNYSYRAESNNEDEKKDVEESFAKSVLWGFQICAEENGSALIDATPFFLQDVHNVSGILKETNQGDYSVDQSRSAFYLAKTKNFPNNSEFDVILTFTGNAKGEYVKSVVPTPDVITVHEHLSFVKLHDDGYKPRVFDPRAGYFDISYKDYATPISEPITKRFIIRHNLKKKNPGAKISEPIKPIIYYVDNGAPEPIRSALMEGAQWWEQAFEAIGYKNAFIVKVLPDSVDPMDVRYNVIQWVHRSTRGWSYGSAVIDPRTGEIIQGRVTLGSLRVRQDYLIAEGLLAPYKKGKPVPTEMLQMALARLRQLAAHEVGHTLGLAHNFAASISNRASVMDYPHPLIKINEDNSLDLRDAYAVGIGEWDKAAIAYGYSEIPENINEKDSLNNIVTNAVAKGLMFISDEDARPLGSAHPYAHLWDNNSNPVDELNRMMKVRKIALSNFSENNIKESQPMADLENVLVPVYLLHRYQLEAAAKSLGGLYYTYALRGDGQKVTEIVSPDQQRNSLNSLLKTIQPEELMLPENILKIIPPQPLDYSRTKEDFASKTGLTFDPLSAAETAASLTIQLILQPERDARLIEYHSRDKNNPGFVEVADKLISATWKAPHKDGYYGDVQFIVDNIVLNKLMALVNNNNVDEVNSIAFKKIKELKNWLSDNLKSIKDEKLAAHFTHAVWQIDQFEDNPEKFQNIKEIEIPAGQPIGSDNDFYMPINR
jgi:Met-zincin/Domain of unknown function (DUF5117)